MQLDFSSPSHPLHFPFGELRGRQSGKKIGRKKKKIAFTPVEKQCANTDLLFSLQVPASMPAFLRLAFYLCLIVLLPASVSFCLTSPPDCLAGPTVPLAAAALLIFMLFLLVLAFRSLRSFTLSASLS